MGCNLILERLYCITNIITAFTLMLSVNGPLGLIHNERKRNVLWIFIAH